MHGDAADIGVYVHWPYCARICPYCDFNVRRNRSVDERRWRDAIRRDLEAAAALVPDRRLVSVYFGGGTPSLAPPAIIADAIDAARSLWPGASALEATLEANPTDAEAARFAAFRDAGVNRLSLGVQSFDDDALSFLGRNHDAGAARRALDLALDIFPRVSIDLIYALPAQTSAQWADQLTAAAGLGAGHLSLYQLTIEPGTAFHRAVGRGRFAPADETRAADLYDLTQAIAADAGFPAYEVSNHARPGEESRHNRLYWRGADYVGVGPGAHGRLTIGGERRPAEGVKDPAAWLDAVESSGRGFSLGDPLTEEEARIEKFALGLRSNEGAALSSRDAAAMGAKLESLVEDGLLRREGARVYATAEGRRLLNAVLAALFA